MASGLDQDYDYHPGLGVLKYTALLRNFYIFSEILISASFSNSASRQYQRVSHELTISGRPSSVSRIDRPSDKGRFITEQKCHDIGDFNRICNPLEDCTADLGLPDVLVCRHHTSFNGPWSHAIEPDMRVFLCSGLCHADDGVLAGDIGSHGREAHQACCTGRIHLYW